MSTAGNESTSEFDDFVNSGEVEVGGDVAETKEEKPRRNPPKEKVEAKPAAEDDQAGEDQISEIEDNLIDEDGQGDEDDEDDDTDKPKKSATQYQIERLKREKADLARQLREANSGDLAKRLENLERGLQGGNPNGNQVTETTPEPDPTDTDKYPLGHLDDRYIEDKLEWLTDKKATERADAVLLRQQEFERNQSVERQQTELLEKVDILAARGTELFDDFQENVVEAGMRGDWDLSQATFEAASEADNGAHILYDLSQDKKEASRVAKLSQTQQVKFVLARDEEITKAGKPRTIPKAGDPPRNVARGANSRTQINPATDNLGDFEKAWQQDAKKSN